MTRSKRQRGREYVKEDKKKRKKRKETKEFASLPKAYSWGFQSSPPALRFNE
jgi:hypothetical protein